MSTATRAGALRGFAETTRANSWDKERRVVARIEASVERQVRAARPINVQEAHGGVGARAFERTAHVGRQQ